MPKKLTHTHCPVPPEAGDDGLTESLLHAASDEEDDASYRHGHHRGEQPHGVPSAPAAAASRHTAIIPYPGEFNLQAFLNSIFAWWQRVFGKQACTNRAKCHSSTELCMAVSAVACRALTAALHHAVTGNLLAYAAALLPPLAGGLRRGQDGEPAMVMSLLQVRRFALPPREPSGGDRGNDHHPAQMFGPHRT